MDSFSDDQAALGESFKRLAGAFPLFAPFAALVDGADYYRALVDALGTLLENGRLAHVPGRYLLTEAGRRSCISNKRSLFGNSDLALTAGLTRTTVGDYERGTTRPKPETLRRLARALGVSVRELLAESLP